jgi:hypothetical protein
MAVLCLFLVSSFILVCHSLSLVYIILGYMMHVFKHLTMDSQMEILSSPPSCCLPHSHVPSFSCLHPNPNAATFIRLLIPVHITFHTYILCPLDLDMQQAFKEIDRTSKKVMSQSERDRQQLPECKWPALRHQQQHRGTY